MSARRRLVVAAGAALVVDAASKMWAAAALAVPVEIGGSLSLQLSRNPGVAFGLGQSAPTGLLLVLTGALCVGLARAGWTGRLQPPLAVGLVLGGAVGNLLDRMVGGSVVDMVHLTWWPTFNLADVAICTGAALIVFDGARQELRGRGTEPIGVSQAETSER
ncbi:signal peptidase II (plasmid) [Iamia sp. SCSIO 61187]|uniref:signal peptidase II n=1 Tax=Iamia sp. SCSIO 61187 TaxID=2722752 RepID=UPI001C6396A0|nr:signal peptidase II [Iamia sp. SCSIO 61187]QYG94368.1 signal peptidase II [Iamia sp. SCSIO 61187]QYG95817.1 signal peptidase II [Iamia sp. SCSIO 61187]